jgi:nucleotide-binding universal stress UspA family protein
MTDDDADEADVRSYLEYAAGRLNCWESPVEIAVRSGSAAEQILAVAHEYHAELLVMSTHGRSGPGRWLYGSVADDVLRTADVPVVLLPPGAQLAAEAERSLRILVPLDGSALSEAALGPACQWAERLGAELVLMQVVEWPPLPVADGAEFLTMNPDKLLAQSDEYLAGVVRCLRSEKTPIRCRSVLGPPVASTIPMFRSCRSPRGGHSWLA